MTKKEDAFPKWFKGVSPDILDTVEETENSGRLLYPESLRHRNASGEIVERPIYLMILRQNEKLEARRLAISLAKKLDISRTTDPEYFDDIDTYCIMATAIRERSSSREQHLVAEDLMHRCEISTIRDLWERYNIYEKMASPKASAIDDDTFWACIGAIAKARHLGPLAVIDGEEQHNFITRMASELSSCQTHK